MIITLDIPEEKWKVLRPILEEHLLSEERIKEEGKPIDEDAISDLHGGVRIMHILQDYQWSPLYTETKRGYIVTTVGQLKRITKTEWLKHRNAGLVSWYELQEYINSLDK